MLLGSLETCLLQVGACNQRLGDWLRNRGFIKRPLLVQDVTEEVAEVLLGRKANEGVIPRVRFSNPCCHCYSV